MKERVPVAVVGVGGLFPKAPTLDAYWENIKGKVCAAADVPPGRWLLGREDAYAAEPRPAPDRVYSTKACLVDGFEFDASGFNVGESLLKGLDPVFHFALHAGRQAWRDAVTEGLDRRRVGVVMGNIALPTDRFSAHSRRLLARELGAALGRPLMEPAEAHPFDRSPAGLPAGLLAQALGLGGGAFTLDAACASSLYAVKLAVDALQEGRADAMLTGGVSRPDCLYTQMGFAQLRALSPTGRPSPLDASGDGLVVGEGAGLFVLKRLPDALRDGDKVYGVVRGAGLSNDIGGSLLAPDGGGQLRAMRAAYAQAGLKPSDVDLYECHATGTPVGDVVELKSLATLWGEQGWKPGQCALGSVKSNVGHLLTGAGAAGLMKVLLAMREKTLPPSANFSRTPDGADLGGTPFRVQSEAAPWEPRGPSVPRRAAVSSFGFGGINAHLIVEEYLPWAAKRRAPSPPERGSPVAVVGMAARFGDFSDLREFQEGVLGGRGPKARLIKDLTVSAAAYRIPPKELAEMLPQQVLMLQTADAALGDAGLKTRDHEKTGVFVGMELDCRTADFHFRWSLPEDLRDSAGPPLSANRTMGALGGIIASRIAREFKVGGPSFTLACDETAGLRALEAAAGALRRGELDCAVVGAVDAGGDPRALAAQDALRPFSRAGTARPFDAAADGCVPGEGAAAVVLKRLDDALQDGDRVYAVLKGVGCASAPDTEAARGYTDALERAYRDAAVAPESVSYLETHGSGSPREDAAEAVALGAFFGRRPSAKPLALGAVKPVIGHTGAASGLASFVKAALALYQEILPPLPLTEPRAELAPFAAALHAPRAPQAWLRNRVDGPRRAGVSAVGLGGNYAHAVLEQLDKVPPHCDRPAERRQPLGARAEALFVAEGDSAPELLLSARRLRAWLDEQPPWRGIEALARAWWGHAPAAGRKALAVAFVARDAAELSSQCQLAEKSLLEDPGAPISGGAPSSGLDRVFYSPEPLGRVGRVAFVFPGSGNQYIGMGREAFAQWPEVLRALDAEVERLKDQFVPELFAPWALSWPPGWEDSALERLAGDHKAMIFGQVSHGAALSDLVRSFGVEPAAVIGYSLGETAGLFALRCWTARDEMLKRMERSDLFVSELAGPCNAARRSWGLAAHEAVDWALGVVDSPEKLVRAAADKMEKVFVLIVNTPKECVVGGTRHAVKKLVEGLGGTFLPLQGVTTVHCTVAKEVEAAYRELHLLETTPKEGVQVYSGAWGRPYVLTRESAADAVTAQALTGVDFPAVVNRAYDDGVRVFLEMGPRNTCSRMVGKILDGKPHAARSACVRDQDDASSVLRLLGMLAAERVPFELGRLYGQQSLAVGHRPETPADPAALVMPMRRPRTAAPKARPVPAPSAPLPPAPRPAPMPARAQAPAAVVDRPAVSAPLTRMLMAAQEAKAAAHSQYLKLSAANAEAQLRLLGMSRNTFPTEETRPCGPVYMDRTACLEFAVGKIGAVLGEAFAEVDAHPTRVRLPDEPLMLVDRILSVSGEARSLTSGGVVTEHDIRPGAWYLDGGRIPTCIAVEAGQADLFLSGYLGIDLKTKGKAVYRLLDAVVTFHDALPGPGQTIRYDIRILRFTRQGDTWLFFFEFDAAVDGRPLLTMRKGCAGFFTEAALAEGKGIVSTELDRRPVAGKRPSGWKDLTPMAPAAYDEKAVDALRRGRLAAAFGPAFAHIKDPMRLPGADGSRMKLLDRVLSLDPQGGRYGLGLIRAEADIRPDDWFLTCHFVDDQVMPGTLMYECCMHTLRVFLMRMGWVKGGQGRFEPLPGVPSQLKCRGQVLPTTRRVVYEISVKELGYGPEPYVLCDALMYADGKPIVLITDMSARLAGASREELEALWASAAPTPRVEPLFDTARITAFAIGKPSEAFGEPYKVFDSQRIIARLPGPPYQFLDRITDIRDCRPFVLEAGGTIVAEYDVPPEAWYFAANRQTSMPYAVLLEAALQPCGWLAAYLGSALRSDVDLSFRNLGGKAVQHSEVFPDSGTLTTRIEITKVSQSVGMIIQNYDMEVTGKDGVVFKGDTYFGFFSKAALSDQKGILGVTPHAPAADAQAGPGVLRDDPSPVLALPHKDLRMLDAIPVFDPRGGPRGLGFLRGTKAVDPAEWFFKAHFYQDPVCPGSLGLESFQQLLKYAARERWGASAGPGARFTPMGLGLPHEWVYRGQVVPRNTLVTVEAVVTKADDATRTVTGDGFLSVDGLLIYQMKGFSVGVA